MVCQALLKLVEEASTDSLSSPGEVNTLNGAGWMAFSLRVKEMRILRERSP